MVTSIAKEIVAFGDEWLAATMVPRAQYSSTVLSQHESEPLLSSQGVADDTVHTSSSSLCDERICDVVEVNVEMHLVAAGAAGLGGTSSGKPR